MYSINTITSYFINKANSNIIDDDGTTEGISHLKLQKVLYFSQAVFLATQNRELFQEEILAWKYGPVIEEIYEIYSRERSKGSNPLLKTDILDENFEDSISSEDKKLLEEIYKEFGKYSAGELVDITHSHKPWKDTFCINPGSVISKQSIKEYYTPIFSVID